MKIGRTSNAFTLIELMLVVIILGVLAAMVLPRLTGRSEEARVAAAKTDVQTNISLALDLFQMDLRRFPTTEEGLAALRTNPGDLPGWKGPYLKREPRDPWGNEYHYVQPGTRSQQDYDLYSAGPNGIEGDEDDIGNW